MNPDPPRIFRLKIVPNRLRLLVTLFRQFRAFRIQLGCGGPFWQNLNSGQWNFNRTTIFVALDQSRGINRHDEDRTHQTINLEHQHFFPDRCTVDHQRLFSPCFLRQCSVGAINVNDAPELCNCQCRRRHQPLSLRHDHVQFDHHVVVFVDERNKRRINEFLLRTLSLENGCQASKGRNLFDVVFLRNLCKNPLSREGIR
mmetsp:Transcript_6742/g.10131  ORF Transcript_6742/g.10131 Transcript_6742/m.10131 type:complete len:200 (-) Transcript_6742:2619-3218(-)